MAELCPISQNVEEIAKKLRISDSDSGDPTSQLPDHVLHSILSYLKSEQLFHARLVSKNWYRNTPSYFPLEFDESIFFEKTPTTPAAVIQESHNKFLEWIRSSLETSQPELIKAEKRVIRVQFKHHENINDLLELINEIDFHETNFSVLDKQGHKLWSISIGRIPTQVVPHIEHLKLDIRFKVPEESHGCLLKYIIDNLLWMSHPNVLNISMSTSFAAFALEICNEFLISRREGNCCADTQNKC